MICFLSRFDYSLINAQVNDFLGRVTKTIGFFPTFNGDHKFENSQKRISRKQKTIKEIK